MMIPILIGYMFLYIHRPFEIWPLLGDLRIERVYMVCAMVYWATLAPKRLPALNRTILAVTIFFCVLLVTSLLSNWVDAAFIIVEDYVKILIFAVMIVTTTRSERELRILAAGFLGVMALYMGHSLWEFICGRHVYRMGIMRMIGIDQTYSDPNTFGASIVYSLPLLIPFWCTARNRKVRALVLAYLALAAVCINLTGSRSSFIGLLVAALPMPYILKFRGQWSLLYLVGFCCSWFLLPESLQNRFLTMIDPSLGPHNAQLSAESRQELFQIGLQLWAQNPVFGVGPGGFAPAVGGRLQSHNLYAQVLAEMGTLGGLALAFLVASFFLNFLEARRYRRRLADRNRPSFSYYLVGAICLSVVLMLILGWGGHNLYRYTWLWFASFQCLALGFLRKQARQEDAEAVYLDLARYPRPFQTLEGYALGHRPHPDGPAF